MSPQARTRSSTATKEAITIAARERFATVGYERTTIRAVAADARIDPAQVMRYFGDKATLFAVAAEFDLRVPDLTGTPRDELGRRMAEHFVDRWGRDEAFTALLRAAATHLVAAERLREIVDVQVTAWITQVAGPEGSGVRAAMIAGHVLGVALCRDVLGLAVLTGMARDELVDRLGAVIQTTLTR